MRVETPGQASGRPSRVLIVGAGRIGQVHARAVSQVPEAVIAGVCDSDLDRATDLATRYGAPVVADLGAALARGEADAIVVGASTDSHLDLVRLAARSGVHVFCEKPLALTVPDIEAAIAACRDAGVALQVGLNRRFDPNALEIASGVHAGRAGRVLTLRITSRDPGPPPRAFIRRSGGLVHDVSIHDFDLCRFILRDEPVEVMAMGGCLVDPMFAEEGDIDVVTITLRFASGTIGVVENTRATSYGYDQRIEVLGLAGAFESENHTAHRVMFRDSRGQTNAVPLPFFLERYEIAFRRQTQAFIDAIRSADPRAAVPVTGEDALQVHRICDAAAQSLREGRPVKLAMPAVEAHA